jgi:8-oxo-dGTP pyrophosphatase MutT (NUDIX family)
VDFAAVESFLRQRLTEPAPGADAQWRFAPVPSLKGWSPDQQPDTARRAAALILLYPDEGIVRFPLTLRRDDLPQHAGQISLPGGALDPGERAEDAALRETHEEIGVDPGAITLLGPMSTLWVVVSNFVLHPFVGVSRTRPDFTPEAREVAAIIEAPLSELRDPSRLSWERFNRRGVMVDYPVFDLSGHRVWGATAMVLGEFASLWDAGHAPPLRGG